MKLILALIICATFAYNIHSQEIPILEEYTDSNYVDFISSITITRDNQQTYLQRRIFPLGRQVYINFDVLGDHDYYYYYTIVHCDKNWIPTDVSRNELISGFDYVRIDNPIYPSGNYTDFVEYNFSLYSPDMEPKVSGNYMLIVFLRDPTEVVFTRKIVISENLMKSQVFGRQTSTAESVNTHHLLEFETEIPSNLFLDNPESNVHLVMYQNLENYGVGPIRPQSKIGNTLRWNYPDKLNFPAGKEWRLSDLRSFRNLRNGIDKLYDSRDSIFIERTQDYERVGRSRDTYQDLNGGFVIQDLDENREGDYALIRYSLKSSLPDFRDVYIVGGFSQFKCLPENKLRYDKESDSYTVTLFQKQGVYDYKYAAKGPDGSPDYAYIEGNDYGTFNKYYGILYYRSFTDRYDRVIGHYCFKYQCESPMAIDCGCR